MGAPIFQFWMVIFDWKHFENDRKNGRLDKRQFHFDAFSVKVSGLR